MLTIPVGDHMHRRPGCLLTGLGPIQCVWFMLSPCLGGGDRRTQDKPTQGEREHLAEGETRGSAICTRHGTGPPWLHLAPATTLGWVTAGVGHMQATDVTHRASVAARLTVGFLCGPDEVS